MPVCLEAHSITIARLRQLAKLCRPVDDPHAHRRPYNLAASILHRILHMAMSDPMLRKQVPCRGIGIKFTTHHCVASVPIKRKVWRRDSTQGARRFPTCCCVARELILQHEQHSLFAAGVRRRLQFSVDSFTIWLHIIQPPEIETTQLIRLELLRQCNALLKHNILLLQSVDTERILLRAVPLPRCSRPIHLEERTCNISHAQAVFGEDLQCLADFSVREGLKVLVPHATQLNPLEPELFRCFRTPATKVLQSLFDDHSDLERRLRYRGQAEDRLCRIGCGDDTCSCEKTTA